MTVASKTGFTFGLAGCTAIVQHVGRVLAALAAVCPVTAPVVSVCTGMCKSGLQICYKRIAAFVAIRKSDIRQA